MEVKTSNKIKAFNLKKIYFQGKSEKSDPKQIDSGKHFYD